MKLPLRTNVADYTPPGIIFELLCLNFYIWAINTGRFLFYLQFSSVQSLNRVQLFATPWTAARQASLSITNSRSSLGLTSIESVMPSSVVPFSFCLQSFPASGSFQMSQLFASVAKVLEFQLQHQSFQWIFRTDFLLDWLLLSPCCPSDSQRVFCNITVQKHHSSMLSFHYSPTATSIHDYWKNHSFDQMDLCRESNVSAF